tara:strand:- start:2197 stop:2400 length:204 start_codon:yes stop_codon:yes gene_type:complete
MRNRLGKPFGPPPKRGPNPQVPPVKLKKGGFKKGNMVGCPHREQGARSDIKGISKIQVKGKKFTGVF